MARSVVLMDLIRHRMPGSVSLFIWWFRGTSRVPSFSPVMGGHAVPRKRREQAAEGVCRGRLRGVPSRMTERWYQKAIIYCLDTETFQDSDGDGAGDFAGLTRRLDYLARLGVDCLWLTPIHPSPGRDGGYDITDYYTVHPRLGTLGDFAVFLQAADSRGIRVIIDLVVNHTSDKHPWFQSARSSADSPYRDWYVWSERGAGRPASGHRLPWRAEGDLDLRQDRGGLVLPPVLPVPAGPQYQQPPGPRRDQEDRVVLAAARGGRVPDGCGAIPHREHQAGRQHGR